MFDHQRHQHHSHDVRAADGEAVRRPPHDRRGRPASARVLSAAAALVLAAGIAAHPARGQTTTGGKQTTVQPQVTPVCDPTDPTCNPDPGPVTRIAPTLDLSPHNGENHDVSLCVNDCFDNVAAVVTPAYVSWDTPRSATIVYRSSQADPRGLVQLVAQDNSSDPASQFSVRVSRAGSYVTFTTGSSELFFTRADGPNWLAAQWAAGSLATGAYDYTVSVASIWSDGTRKTSSTTVRVLVVNEQASPYGAGWSVAGLQRIYGMADGSKVLIEGDGSVKYFAKISCPAGCTYQSPAGDFSTLIYNSSANLFERSYPDGGKATFFGDGRLSWTGDRFNNRTNFAYVGSTARLSTITDPAGKVLTFAYDASARLDYIRDPGNRTTDVTVNVNNDLVTVRDAQNYTTTFGYTSHLLTQQTDARGGAWTYGYDIAGKLAAVGSPSVTIAGASQQLVAHAQAPEAIGVPGYIRGGGSGSASSPAAVRTPADIAGFTVTPKGRGVKHMTDRFGGDTLVALDTGLGPATHIARDLHSRVTRTIAPNGATTTVSYTAGYPNPTQVLDGTTNRTVTIGYDPTYKTDVVSVTGDVTPVYNTITSGKLTASRVGSTSALPTTYGYATNGRLTSATDPEGHQTVIVFDGAGTFQNTATVTAPNHQQTQRRYDAFGRVRATVSPDRSARDSVEYDALNRVTATVDALNNRTTSAYDALFLVAVNDAKGQTYGMSRNALGWLESETDPGSRTRTATYDADGAVASTTDRRGNTVTFQYDQYGALSQRTAGGDVATFKSDSIGRFVAGANAESVDTVFYDMAGRDTAAVTVRGQATFVQRMTYDAKGRRSGLRLTPKAGPVLTMRYGYGDKGTLDTIVDFGGHITTRGTNNDRLPVTMVLPNGVQVTRQYMNLDQNGSVTLTGAAASLSRSYGFDPVGRQHRRAPGNTLDFRQFDYDLKGQLTTAYDAANGTAQSCQPVWDPDLGVDTPQSCTPGTPPTIGQRYDFTYDQVGNPTDHGAVVQAGNRLTSYDGYSIDYDLDGNVQQKRAPGNTVDATLTWDALGQLTNATKAGHAGAAFGYDAFGRRARKTSISGGVATGYLDDGDDLLAELNADGTVRAAYTYYAGVDQPHSVQRGAQTYYFVQDEANDVVGLVDGTGAVTSTYAYQPFGAAESVSDPLGNPLRWKGREYDTETGLYYNRARYYDPQLGRFNAEDPIGLDGGVNLYAFAANDPIDNADPSGLDCKATSGTGEGKRNSNGQVELPAVQVCAEPDVPPTPVASAPAIQGSGSRMKDHRRPPNRPARPIPSPPPGPTPMCTEQVFRGNAGDLYVRTSPDRAIAWTIRMHNPLADDGPWYVDVFVDDRRVDHKKPPKQVYRPHGSVNPKDATQSGIFRIEATHTDLVGITYTSIPNACIIP